MENITFRLKDSQSTLTPASQKETLIYLFFSYGVKAITTKGNERYKPIKYSTGLKIKPYQWNKDKCRAKQTSNFDYISFNTVLDNIETIIKKTHREKPNSTPEQLKTHLANELHPEKNVIPETITLNRYITQFINEIENGKETTSKGNIYKETGIKIFRTFKRRFLEYQQLNKITLDFNDIDEVFYKSYKAYLISLKYAPNSIGKHIKVLKTLMNKSRKLKHHNNTEVNNFAIPKTKTEHIYLNETEIKTIYNLDLSNNKQLEIVRDVFLVGCYTAQRFSDYSKIYKNNIKDNRFIELFQVKTGEKVIIPIRSELNNILKKYNYNLPKTYEQKVNKGIKIICQLANITDIILVENIKGGEKIKTKVPKYELVTTHTARRSGATNMYLAEIPTLSIMKITGHRTESSFLTYIKVTKQETAEKLSNHPYFNN